MARRKATNQIPDDQLVDNEGTPLTVALLQRVVEANRPLRLDEFVSKTGRNADVIEATFAKIAETRGITLDEVERELLARDEFGDDEEGAPSATAAALEEALNGPGDPEDDDPPIRVNSGNVDGDDGFAQGREVPLPGMPEPSRAWGKHDGRDVSHGMGLLHGSIRLPDSLSTIRLDDTFVAVVRFRFASDGFRANATQEGKKATLHKNVSLDVIAFEIQ